MTFLDHGVVTNCDAMCKIFLLSVTLSPLKALGGSVAEWLACLYLYPYLVCIFAECQKN